MFSPLENFNMNEEQQREAVNRLLNQAVTAPKKSPGGSLGLQRRTFDEGKEVR
jgi:hypothetical protein